MGWRYIAQRITTKDFLDWDVPLVADGPPRRELSGPGSLTGTISPEYLRLTAQPDGLPILAEWSTALYAEFEGRIRWAGLITGIKYQGQAMKITATGFSAYAHGLPFLGIIQSGMLIKQKWAYEGKDKNNDGYIDGTKPKRKMPPRPKDKLGPRVDAFDVVREIWTQIQSYPHGNLGLVVDGHDAGYAMGTPSGSDPYELLWWNFPDCGTSIDDVMKQAGADYAEYHYWDDGGRENVKHRLLLGHKRLGQSRPNLRFAQGENIIEYAQPQFMGEKFANEIYMIGQGSGKTTTYSRVIATDKRLRRAKVIPRKTTRSHQQLSAWGRTEQLRNSQMLVIPSIAISHHSNAPFGSWALGDLIFVQVDVPWVGEVGVWHRIVAEEIDPAQGTAVLSLTRADHY